ncbi:PAS domain S-box protein, partial [Rubrivirga sp.]|uniref:sensor histidine kinase n=1 Tax=Rubrivirga sp. TaxID=1885344 RepID=UPI003C753BB7
MFRSIHPDYAFPLAELALCELSKAGAGEIPASGRSEAAIVSDAVGVPAVLFVPTDNGLEVEASAGGIDIRETVAATGALAESLIRGSCIDLRPVPQELADLGVQSGLAVRVGTEAEPLAILTALAPDVRTFDADARGFLQGAATALHARFVLERTRHQLEESQARARSILQTTVDGIITIDNRGRIESFNDGAVRIFGYDPDEVVGRNVSVLMPDPYHSEHDGYMAAYRETGRRQIIGIGREVTGRRKSGAPFPMDLAVSEVTLPGGETLFTGIVRDLTEHRVLEREVLRVAEAERRRIGQDLHDGLGQDLTAIGLFLRNHARALEAEESPSALEVRRLVGLVDGADTQARTLARSLVPVELEENGLEAALGRLAERATTLYDLEVVAETSGSGPAEASALTADAASNLYRIAQEAISNAAQHGQADLVTVGLFR